MARGVDSGGEGQMVVGGRRGLVLKQGWVLDRRNFLLREGHLPPLPVGIFHSAIKNKTANDNEGEGCLHIPLNMVGDRVVYRAVGNFRTPGPAARGGGSKSQS